MFISLEGIEGAGKSTVQKELAHRLQQEGHNVVATREPGATTIGAKLRAILLDPSNTQMAPMAELMIFAADRAQHLVEVIRPALARGSVVLCDRFIHSTLAYQGYGRSLDFEVLHTLNNLATDGLKPDLVLLFDLDPEVGLERAKSRQLAERKDTSESLEKASSWSRFEAEKLNFHKKLRHGFLELARDPNNHFALIDAAQPLEHVIDQAYQVICQKL